MNDQTDTTNEFQPQPQKRWYQIKARDMSIFKPDGKVVTFWLWGPSRTWVRDHLGQNDNFKQIESIKAGTPSFEQED